MKKVLLTATVQSHICQFHKPLVHMLHEQGYEVHVAARNNLAEKNGLALDFVEKVFDVPFSRSPRSMDNLKAWSQLKKIIDRENYEIIHCNTPMGGIITRLAAIGARRKGSKVYYTVHGFHFYKGAPLKNWLVFFPIEWIMALFCDKLITITKEDDRRAKQLFHTTVEHMHGVGVYTDRYHPVGGRQRSQMREAEGLGDDEYIILCTGELNSNKNQKTLIAAVKKLQESIPEIKVLLAGNGLMEQELRKQIKDLGLEEQVKLLGYRTDLEKLTPAVDLVVSCSFREGMPLNIIEAMLCRKPVVVSINRGHKELVKHGFNGYRVKADDVDSYVRAISELHADEAKSMQFGARGYRRAQAYSAESVENELKNIYLRK